MVALAVSLVVLVLGFMISVSVGASDLAFAQVVAGLIDRLPGVAVDSGLSVTEESILWQWRVPRAVLSALVGAALAMSGATFQGVFRNPLADPYLLGVAAGAGLGATLAIVGGADFGWGPVHAVPMAAFAGALLAVVASAVLGFGTSRSASSLLLAGVAVASFLTAVQTFVMQRNTDLLAEVYSWILGRLGTFGWTEVTLLAPYVVVCGLVAIALSRHLDVMQLGDDEASALGVNVIVVRSVLVVAASLLAAAAVSVSGLIAFVGIIVPHFVRLAVGSSYRVVLPLSALGGAAFLVVADVGARTIAAGSEVPIGVVTAFFGAPFFALVLWTKRGALQ
ncbi:MAG: iron ABC transporter permease [Acidimicrobiia bacterium]|nr:iron ABC transporter permease [Acidimicrobiia bacterium]